MRKKVRRLLLILIIIISFLLISIILRPTDIKNEENMLTNLTRAYFAAGVTRNYRNGDCILLENYDSDGNKIYGLIDAGRKIETIDNDGNSSTLVKDFLKNHDVEKLEFLAITHSHADHNGDALTVLENFEVSKIYMKEYDYKWSPGEQKIYEKIIQQAINKDIKVIGVSYLSLKSSEISPSRSQNFIQSISSAKESLFESFYYNGENDTNTMFTFGSATIQIFNWEIFDATGKQYITGVTTNATKETVPNENNNSIAFLLKQGNKKAFFSGDMNNLDENTEKRNIRR